jgi:hypothetical protein
MVRRRRLLADLGFRSHRCLHTDSRERSTQPNFDHGTLKPARLEGNCKLKGKGNGRLGRAASLQKYVHRSADATNLKGAQRALPGAVSAAAYAPAFLRLQLRRCPTEPAGAHWQTPRQLQAHGSCQWAEPLDSWRESRAQRAAGRRNGHWKRRAPPQSDPGSPSLQGRGPRSLPVGHGGGRCLRSRGRREVGSAWQGAQAGGCAGAVSAPPRAGRATQPHG